MGMQGRNTLHSKWKIVLTSFFEIYKKKGVKEILILFQMDLYPLQILQLGLQIYQLLMMSIQHILIGRLSEQKDGCSFEGLGNFKSKFKT